MLASCEVDCRTLMGTSCDMARLALESKFIYPCDELFVLLSQMKKLRVKQIDRYTLIEKVIKENV